MEKLASTHAQNCESVAESDHHTVQATKHENVPLGPVSSHTEPMLTRKDEIRCLRKVDFILLPLLVVSFSLQYIDKVILNGAAQFGIFADLGLYKLVDVNPATHKPILDLHRCSIATLIFHWGALAGSVCLRIFTTDLKAR